MGGYSISDSLVDCTQNAEVFDVAARRLSKFSPETFSALHARVPDTFMEESASTTNATVICALSELPLGTVHKTKRRQVLQRLATHPARKCS